MILKKCYELHSRLGVFGEATLVIRIATALSLLLLLDGILASAIALDDANNDANDNEEEHGENHANEPTRMGKHLTMNMF